MRARPTYKMAGFSVEKVSKSLDLKYRGAELAKMSCGYEQLTEPHFCSSSHFGCDGRSGMRKRAVERTRESGAWLR